MLHLARLRPMLPLVGAFGQEPLHKDAVFVHVLDRESMVWAWPFKQPLKVARGTLHGLLASLVVGVGHERALTPLFVLLLVGTVGGALASVLVPLCLALRVVKNCPDHLLAQGMAGGDVEDLLGGSRALTS